MCLDWNSFMIRVRESEDKPPKFSELKIVEGIIRMKHKLFEIFKRDLQMKRGGKPFSLKN